MAFTRVAALLHAALSDVGVNQHHNQLHQAAHNAGGGDQMRLDNLQTPEDNTDLDFTTALHGLVPKGTNTGLFLGDAGSFAAPPDCRIASGTYTGDGATSQAITGVGFQVVYVRVVRTRNSGDPALVFETWPEVNDDGGSALKTDMAVNTDLITEDAVANAIIALGADGFTVDDAGSDLDPNTNLQVYNFIAWGT